MVDLRDVTVGQSVFIVPQKSRHAKQEQGFAAVVTKIGRKYATATATDGKWKREYEFNREFGSSKEKPDSNVRVNGFGFDVYHDVAEVVEQERQRQVRALLPARLVNRWGSLKDIPFECVEKIHALLTDYGVE